MKLMETLSLIIFFAVTGVHLYASLKQDKKLRNQTKPFILLSLLAFYCFRTDHISLTVTAALLFSWLVDVLPMPKGVKWFTAQRHRTKKSTIRQLQSKDCCSTSVPAEQRSRLDGKSYTYDNVWLTAAMKGRYYGGGMMIAPSQDRNSDHLTLAIYKTGSKLKALINFPSIFEGKHVEKKDLAVLHTGRKIHVRFSRPCTAQIDGDTVLNVTEYEGQL